MKSPKKCGYESGVEYDDDYYEHSTNKREIKGMFGGINGDYITVGDKKFMITDNTYCEIDTKGEEDRYYVGKNCLTAFQNISPSTYVEVKYVEQNDEDIALEVDIEYEEEESY